MKRTIFTLLLAVTASLLFTVPSSAFDQGTGFLCVNNNTDLGADFQAALDAVTGANNEVRLRQGTFDIANDPQDGHFTITADHGLEISGGWNADCSAQTDDPELTILNGGPTQENEGGVLSVIIIDNPLSLDVSIFNLTFRNGSSELDGGGLYFEHTFTPGGGVVPSVTLNLYDFIAEDNSTSAFGSGIAVFDFGTTNGTFVNISDCIIQNNTVPPASLGGPAGILVDSLLGTTRMKTTITKCQILNNSAVQEGSGLYINSGNQDTILVNNIIAGNTISGDSGGGLYILNTEGGNITLTNNTITGNQITSTEEGFQDGGGVFVIIDNDSSIVDIYNNIIYNNSAIGDGNDISILNPLGTEVNIHNSDFDNSQPGGLYVDNAADLSLANNLNNVDPLFENAANDDYHLTSQSPAIALGDNIAPEVPSDDLDYNPRPVNVNVDMGAYEFQTGVTTTSTSSTTTTSTTSTTQPGGSTTTSTTSTTQPPVTTSTTTTTTTTTTLPGSTTTTTLPSSSGGGGGGGCFINTAGDWKF